MKKNTGGDDITKKADAMQKSKRRRSKPDMDTTGNDT